MFSGCRWIASIMSARMSALHWLVVPLALLIRLLDAAPGTRSLGTAASIEADPIITEADLKGCSFEVIMTEDRGIPEFVEHVNSGTYWSMTGVVNSAYADRHGYRFQYVHVNQSLYRRSWMCKYHPAWVKLFYLEQRLQEIFASATSANSCTWILYLDSDAFVRGFDAPLPSFIAHLARKYRIRRDVAAIFAEDQAFVHPKLNKMSSVPPFRPIAPWLNSGVFLLQATPSSRRFLQDWIAGGADGNQSLQLEWPLEMGTLTEMIRPGSWPKALAPGVASFSRGAVHATRVSVVDMVEMNSPMGRFAQHLWGYHRYRREVDIWDALIRTGLSTESRLKAQLLRLREQVLPWGPNDKEGTCYRDRNHYRDKRRVIPPCYDGFCEEAGDLA